MAGITIRRHDPFLYTVVGAAVAGFALVTAALWPLTDGAMTVMSAAAVSVLALAYLDGPVAYVRVGGSLVTVANAFSIHHIPRIMIADVGGYEDLAVKLRLTDGRRVSITAYEPSLNRWGGTRRSYVKYGRQLERAMEAVPVYVFSLTRWWPVAATARW